MTKERIEEINQYLELQSIIARNIDSSIWEHSNEYKMIRELYDAYLNIKIQYNASQKELKKSENDIKILLKKMKIKKK